MADQAPETAVPIKVPEPEDHAPPTLAEPASGPVAEMSGALAGEEGKGAAATNESSVADANTSSMNGTAEAAAESTAEKPDETTEQNTTQTAPATEETEAKEAIDPAPVETETTAETNSTPGDKKTPNGKRKSIGGVPEHKSKKLNKKKSIAKITHLDAQPGDLFFARLKSYPPWPSIICDEEMLPQTLLDTRPVTTKKEDGTYNEPYADGGKKVMDRTYPIMFLFTNEFAWIPNTDLAPLKPEECKDVPPQKKTKSLISAYEVAAEGHDLQHFKSLLADHARAIEEDEEAREAAAAEKAAKAESKKKRKSEAKVVNEDTEMADADADAPAKKASKKRKKEADSDDEDTEKPAKTPKTTKLKLTTNKTPTTDKKAKEPKAAKPKSEKKSKKGAAEPEKEEEKEEEPLDPVEARKAREKEVLFLRHKLQKGFLSRDQAPREDEMPQMSNFIKKLEVYADLEVAIIRATKINKVLKALVKLNTIPRDEEFQFRKRSVELLGKWNKILGTEAEPAEKEEGNPPTNGVHDEKDKGSDDASDEKKEDVEEPEDKVLEPAEAIEKVSAEVPADAGAKASVIDSLDKDADTEMKDAEPEGKADAASAIERVPESAAAAHEAQEVVKASE